MYRDGLRNEVANDVEVLGLEDFEVVQIGEEQGVGGRCGLFQRGEVGEVECEVGLIARGIGGGS